MNTVLLSWFLLLIAVVSSNAYWIDDGYSQPYSGGYEQSVYNNPVDTIFKRRGHAVCMPWEMPCIQDSPYRFAQCCKPYTCFCHLIVPVCRCSKKKAG